MVPEWIKEMTKYDYCMEKISSHIVFPFSFVSVCVDRGRDIKENEVQSCFDMLI